MSMYATTRETLLIFAKFPLANIHAQKLSTDAALSLCVAELSELLTLSSLTSTRRYSQHSCAVVLYLVVLYIMKLARESVGDRREPYLSAQWVDAKPTPVPRRLAQDS